MEGGTANLEECLAIPKMIRGLENGSRLDVALDPD
jgi:hypothetical protein